MIMIMNLRLIYNFWVDGCIIKLKHYKLIVTGFHYNLMPTLYIEIESNKTVFKDEKNNRN
jgi:hypothetical protein